MDSLSIVIVPSGGIETPKSYRHLIYSENRFHLRVIMAYIYINILLFPKKDLNFQAEAQNFKSCVYQFHHLGFDYYIKYYCIPSQIRIDTL